MPLLHAIFLGALQAITEFLPVSSTAHLLVFGQLLGQDLADPRFRAFAAIIQLGTTIAVIAYFRADLWRIVREDRRLAGLIVAGSVPAGVAGLLLERRIEALGNWVFAASLIGLGVLLFLAEKLARHTRTIAEIGLADALLVGCAQACALVPGASRSGTTLTAGLFLGFRRDDAARFSFLLSVPIICAAGLFKLRKALPALSGEPDWRDATIAATAVAGLLGYLVIGWLLRYLRTRTTLLFVVWRILAGLLIALFLTV